LINLRSPWAIIALVFAAMPPVMAKLYVANRDFANLVTQTRMIFSVQDTAHWELEPALQGVGFLQPIMLQFPPDGAAKIYVLERAGRLWRADLDGQNKELLLDFTRRVGLVDIENGALGFDQHPEFGRAGANAGFVYIYYTDLADGRQLNRLSRFDLAAADPAARLASESVLIEFRRNNSGFHNGGSVEFGPDRFLYLAIGEATNIPNHQRIDRDLLGGVLRIDVDRRGGAISHPPLRQPLSGKTGNYFIPNDNPFVGQPDALEEFWAIGLRNPFRIAFDSATGRLWTGDVGSTEWEEVNILENGGNYLDCTPAVRQGN
jgi:glucose/arabinose dehydrogenase